MLPSTTSRSPVMCPSRSTRHLSPHAIARMRRVFERTLIHATFPTYKLTPFVRYISQVRQEIAVRLHARLYPGGVGPSKVQSIHWLLGRSR